MMYRRPLRLTILQSSDRFLIDALTFIVCSYSDCRYDFVTRIYRRYDHV